jgi:nucleoside-diphosphate-sugar epimerase
MEEHVAMMADFWAVTGANGFLARALRDDLRASLIPSRGLARGGEAEIVADVRDRGATRRLVRGASVVVHAAAYVHRPANGRAAEEECWSVNVDGTESVLDAMAAESPYAFLVFVSSSNVYGPSEEALDESAPCRPVTAYGRSKLEAEHRVLARIRDGSLRGCVLRPAMIFGPGAPGNLGRLARMVRSGFVIEIAHGEQRKSVVPISFAVGAIRAAAAQQAACNGEIINVAGETLTIHQIIEMLAAQRGRTPFVFSIPGWIARAASLVLLSRRQMVETYMTSAVLRGEKLGRLTGFRAPQSATEALRLTTASAPR